MVLSGVHSIEKPKKKKKLGCLIKNFRHDKKTSPRSERDGLESLRGER